MKRPCILAVLLVLSASAVAQDPQETNKALADQRNHARETARRVGLAKSVVIETDDLLVVSDLSEAKAKLSADAAQKAFQAAKTILKFSDMENLWPGKLTVYLLSSSGQYGTFIRLIEQRRPDRNAWYSLNTRINTPYAVVAPEAGVKVTDLEIQRNAGTIVAGTVLARKAGATPAAPLPEWLTIGFGRVVQGQAEGGARWGQYRTKMKAAVLGSRTKPGAVRLSDIWDGRRNAESEFVWASLSEYLAMGPDSEKFMTLLNAMKPNENGEQPGFAGALQSLEWKPDELELAWKRWVATGK